MLHQIGIGTLGPVFRTYEPSRDRLVAVKAFRLDIVPEQAQALADALSRAAHASLFHPSIVAPIDAGLEGTVAYRAEEYVAAESLDVAMRHYAPAPIEKVLPFITQLAGAVDFARAAGIGHGGLHPRDIFVTPDEARATGFGVVDALEQVGIRAPIRRPYSAPERIDGRAWSTPADVFSLAAITFELLTGKRPAGTGAQIGTLPDGPSASALHAVLARAMHDDPSQRYVSALAFAGAIEAASHGRPLTDAVSPAAAVAAAPEPVAVTNREPVDVHPNLFEQPTTPVAPAGPPPIPAPVPVRATAPGELAIEAALDPVHEALDEADDTQKHEAAFAFEREPAAAAAPTLFGSEDDVEPEPFSDDFVEEQAAEPELSSPLEATVVREPPPVEAPPMFRSVAAEPDLHDVDYRRPAMLPYAVLFVLGLLVGFGGGYFVGSRDRITSSDAAQPVSQYSEQKVSAPPPAAAGTPAVPKAAEPKAAEPKAAEPKAAEPKAVESAPAVAAPVESAPPGPKPAVPRETAPPPSRGAVPKGQILIRSLPTHAGVTINGRWRGRTPLTLDGMALGNYSVRVVQPGYQVSREEFTLSAAAPSHTVTARLVVAAPAKPAAPAPSAAAPETFTGSLYIDSRPRGANVLIDGTAVGQTPLSVPDVRAGSHVVRIEMDGKKPVTANPRVTAGKTERVTVSLEDKQ